MPRILTFPITGVEVPPVAVVSRGADPLTDISSWSPVDVTPTLWPPAGAKASAFEVEVTAVDEQLWDGDILIGVSPDNALDDIPGTWSGDDGAVSVVVPGNDADGWRFNKFGGWRTEYLTFATANSSNNLLSMPDRSGLAVSSVDVRAWCRRSDWDANPGTPRIIAVHSASWVLSILDDTVWVQVWDAVNQSNAACPLSTFGVSDGQWHGIGFSYDGAGTISFLSSSDGESWSTVHTAVVPRGALRDPVSTLRVGNGAGLFGTDGFGGSIAWVEIRSGGSLIESTDFSAMESSTDTSWTSRSGATWTKGDALVATGAVVPATRRARFEFDAPTDVSDWRLFVDAAHGSVSVDEIVLELEHRGWFAGQPIGVT